MRRIIAVISLIALAGCAASPAVTNPVPAFPVFFQTWSAAIDPTAASTISTAAKAALANPEVPVTVTGAADTVGSMEANKYLSKTRAQVVADALAADGVPYARIKIKALGAVNAPGVAPGSYAQFSRRVLIQIGS